VKGAAKESLDLISSFIKGYMNCFKSFKVIYKNMFKTLKKFVKRA